MPLNSFHDILNHTHDPVVILLVLLLHINKPSVNARLNMAERSLDRAESLVDHVILVHDTAESGDQVGLITFHHVWADVEVLDDEFEMLLGSKLGVNLALVVEGLAHDRDQHVHQKHEQDKRAKDEQEL